MAHRPDATPRARTNIRNVYSEPVTLSLFHDLQSLMVNAAVIDGQSEPTNAPWLVDPKLPIALKY